MKKILIIFILCFCFLTNVKADVCSAQEKLKYMNEAVKVTASYEFLKDEAGRSYFAITVYNLSPNVAVFYNDKNGNEIVLIGSDEKITETFNDYDTEEVFTYRFKVSVRGEGDCLSNITEFSLTKPKKNYYYDNVPECKYEKMKDYFYCKEWITSDFKIEEKTIINNIKNEFNKTTTSISESSEESDNLVTLLQLYIKYRIYILIGLGIGIVADIVYIFLSYKRIKEGEF